MTSALYLVASLVMGQVTCQEVNCTGDTPELWLQDAAGELHAFTENITEVAELKLEKGVAVSTKAGNGESLSLSSLCFSHCHFSGECCFVLFSETDGEGNKQLLEHDTETTLGIHAVRSAYIVECYKYDKSQILFLKRKLKVALFSGPQFILH